ncbi:hypothetical protein DFR52_102824 [Hoeflea marina]|uniref:Peptidoglycan binding protein n=1 Tax=Hoeflea marina TaxID=274592 RepID=A0A317PN07_9HYPH|nr:peptidoglycan-binding domain-containing protein [Hoeflea marina]PWW02156.1 hypothetical protein DFR52_102824 [Hoeflea marina]
MKKLAIVMLAFFAVFGRPASGFAQNINGFINLMGKVIENDIQTKRQDRQRELEFQARKNEQKRQYDEQRRAEIELAKRLQTGLQALGFYTSKIDGDRGPGTLAAERRFSMAFGLPQLSLSENDVRMVERYASAGFRNQMEAEKADAGGFYTRDELVSAERSGFSNAAEFRDAKAMGIGSYDDYSGFKRSGFTEVSDFMAAKRGGFESPADYKQAAAKGFDRKDEYSAFVQSGAADKQEFQVITRQKELAQSNIAECIDAPVANALQPCVVALGLAASNDPALQRRFAEIGAYLAERRATLFELTTAPKELASSAGSASTTDAARPESSPDAGAFLVELASVDAALKVYECGNAYLSAQWATTASTCATADNEANPGVAQLAAIAKSNQLEEAQQASAEAERKRAAAEAERTRIALSTALERATALQTSLGDYASSGGRFANPLPIARATVELRKQTETEDFKGIEQAALALEELVASETGFQTFIDQTKRATEIAAVNANAAAEAELQRMEAFIEDYVTRNIVAPEVADLLAVQSDLSEARESGNSDRILIAGTKGLARLGELKLTSALADFVLVDTAAKAANIEQADNGLAVTGLNKELLTGESRDILILGNFTPAAPHLAINLIGDVTFTAATARFCWQSGVSDLTVPVKLAVRELEAMGVNRFEDAGRCPTAGLDRIDVVLLERGKLLADDILNVKTFIAGYEQRDIREIASVLWADVGAKSVQARETAELVQSEILGGVRSGYGVVRFANQALQICLAIPGADESAHLDLLASENATLDLEFQGALTTEVMDLERAFITAQRNNCAAIYTDATNLKMVLTGAERAGLSVRMLPFWFNDERVAGAKTAIAAARDQTVRTLAARRAEQERQRAALDQEKQARAAQQAIDDNTAAAVRARKTAELRAQFGSEAKAAYNGLNDLGVAFFQDRVQSEFPRLFPAANSWASDKLSNGWLFTKYSGELRDYGTGDWKGRRTEVVLVDMTIDASNSVRGEYSNDCFTAGYLIDSEFGQMRDSFIDSCDSSAAITAWQESRKFESRWSAE